MENLVGLAQPFVHWDLIYAQPPQKNKAAVTHNDIVNSPLERPSIGGLPSSCHVKRARHLDGKLQYKALAEMNKVQYRFFYIPLFFCCV